MISKDKYNIEFVKLTTFAPQDTIWVKEGAELVGLSKSKKLHIVIDDGCCCDDDGKWLVNVYKIKDIEQRWKDFFPNEERNYFFKYPNNGEDEKLIEEWVDFTSWDSICDLREKIESGKCYIGLDDEDEEQVEPFNIPDKCTKCANYYRGNCLVYQDYWNIDITQEVIDECEENNNYRESIIRLY
jgi:hypothetical protein